MPQLQSVSGATPSPAAGDSPCAEEVLGAPEEKGELWGVDGWVYLVVSLTIFFLSFIGLMTVYQEYNIYDSKATSTSLPLGCAGLVDRNSLFRVENMSLSYSFLFIASAVFLDTMVSKLCLRRLFAIWAYLRAERRNTMWFWHTRYKFEAIYTMTSWLFQQTRGAVSICFGKDLKVKFYNCGAALDVAFGATFGRLHLGAAVGATVGVALVAAVGAPVGAAWTTGDTVYLVVSIVTMFLFISNGEARRAPRARHQHAAESKDRVAEAESNTAAPAACEGAEEACEPKLSADSQGEHAQLEAQSRIRSGTHGRCVKLSSAYAGIVLFIAFAFISPVSASPLMTLAAGLASSIPYVYEQRREAMALTAARGQWGEALPVFYWVAPNYFSQIFQFDISV